MAVGKRLKSLVKQLADAPAPPSPWRPNDKPYPILASFEPDAAGLKNVSGLFAVWHLGVRPQWLKVAACADLSLAIRAAISAPAIAAYKPNGGVYVAWAALPKTPALLNHAQHLIVVLKPLLQETRLEGELITPPETKPLDFSLPPGTQ